MKFNVGLSSDDFQRVMKWRIVKLTGWTLDYIDSLPYGRLLECVQVEDGMTKAKG